MTHLQSFIFKGYVRMIRGNLRRVFRAVMRPRIDWAEASVACALLEAEVRDLNTFLRNMMSYYYDRALEQGPREAYPRVPSGSDPA